MEFYFNSPIKDIKERKKMILARIHNKYKSLTETERKIASFVLQNPSEVLSLTAKELADRCATVPSAVIRFCKSVECEGFSALKIMLAQTVGVENDDDISKLPAFSDGDGVQDVFKKVFSSCINTLSDTYKMIDIQEIEVVCKKILNAKRIFLFGVGTSSVVAIDAQYRFSQLGLNAVSCTDIVFMNVTGMNVDSSDVVIGISHSGRTKAVVDAIERSKQAGATTVAITSFEDSPLAKESDYKICVFADEENYPVEAVSARVAHVCIIDALTMTLVSNKKDDLEKHIVRRNAILRDLRY